MMRRNAEPKFRTLSLWTVSFLASGCVSEVPPTIAHVHIGHAITGWEPAPDEQGLLVVAEKEARIAVDEARLATQGAGDLEALKAHVRNVMHAVEPNSVAGGAGLGYGLRNAAEEAVHHIVYAGESEDASANVQTAVTRFADKSDGIIERCALILALGMETLDMTSAENAGVLAEEIRALSMQNVAGADLDGDGVIGSRADEYGVVQIRDDLSAMIERESPPYEPVATRFLFGLIRLPSGIWVFRESLQGDTHGSSYR